MSGTSFDAIDAAAADLAITGDGTGTDASEGRGSTLTLTPLGVLSQPYPPDLREAIVAALPPAEVTMGQVCQLDTRIGQAFADLAKDADTQLCQGTGDLVVSSGQTAFHWVRDGRAAGTLQLGQPAWIAEATGLPVVADLRSRDVAAGGHGAPLVSLFDVLWLAGRPGTPVALNLGGIANITVVRGPEGQGGPVAYDTGPANALIDAGTRHVTGGRLEYDVDGDLAGRGHVDDELLHRLLAEPYYALPAPKSTGKELFHLPHLLTALDGLAPMPPEDVVATLTALTATTVAEAVHRAGGTEVIAAGGGTANPVLMRMLAERLGTTKLLTTADLGVPTSAKEAYAFAVLGYLSAHGLPGTVPSATGARHPSILGSITPGRQPWRTPAPRTAGPTRLVITAAGSGPARTGPAAPRARRKGDPVSSDLAGLRTESPNPRSTALDAMDVHQLLALMNDEDASVAPAVRRALTDIAAAVQVIAAAFRAGGRLVYVGAGTSGRLAVLDAAECPPTFGIDPGQVLGLVAGGERALLRAVEGAEDSPDLGRQDLQAVGLGPADVVVGLSASGRTPYVLGALDHARAVGARTISIACNPGSQVSAHADIAIEVDNGPEVLTGSTRLKAGTSQKLVLNMLSTAAMVLTGKVYGNLMVDVVPTNHKLEIRARTIIEAATGVDPVTALDYQQRADGSAKTAIVMILAGVDAPEADRRLTAAGGLVRDALHG
jgi:anhydro-N-acetylmuramic acid kinase